MGTSADPTVLAERPGAVASARAERLLDGLNDPQREAVTHGEGPLLILAGAGSGKTKALTHRIAYLLFSGKAHPAEILAITFTNKAANEMRERVQRLVGASTRGMWLMTFHSACARILRAQAELLGYTSSFTIYDQADSRRLVKRCLEDLDVDTKRFTPALVQAQISQAKNKLLTPAEAASAAADGFEEMLAEVHRRYQRELAATNAMDFDDLLCKTVALFESHRDARARYAQAFKHVLVDEYQDTNRVQYKLLRLLVDGEDADGKGEPGSEGEPQRHRHRNLAVVGDDAQSIYSFRGAEVRNILDFERDFPDAKVVKLQQNYRSTQTILSVANAVIANNRGGIAKRLWSEHGKGEAVRVRGLPDEYAEARYIVGEIERLLDEGHSRAEIAVLYRVNSTSRVIEDLLMRREIAYQVIGGTKFYERAEIKDAVAYLAFIANPRDAFSFQRIVGSPRRGIGQASVAKALSHADSLGVSISEALADPRQVPGLGAAAVKAFTRFLATIEELRELALNGASVAELLQQTLTRSGYIEALQTEARESPRWAEAQGRIENLQQLVDVAEEFEAGAANANESSLALFLQEVALLADSDSRNDEESLVTLMTLHNAKGLEYPVVFIAACEEGIFPHARALDEGGLEEERRLFYVGVTRAMRELYLTYASSRRLFGKLTAGLPSSFIAEVPRELVDFDEEMPRGFGYRPSTYLSPAPSTTPVARRLRHSDEERASVPPPTFRLGADVEHATFGSGVITGVEQGGIVDVRFAADGCERKLMVEYLQPVSASA